MATTSGNLTAGAATSGGRGGDGTGHKRRAAGLVATATLGLGLLTGMIFSEAHQAAPPTSGNLPVARPQVWTGTCRAGGSDCLPDEDYAAPAAPNRDGAGSLPLVEPTEFRGNGYTER